MKLWLLDKDEILMKQLNVISTIHTEEVNGENVLNFECHEEVSKYDRVMYKDSLNNWHEFMVQEVVDNRDTNSVYAEHSSYELRGDIVEDKSPTKGPRGHLEELLVNTRWTIGDIGNFGTLRIDYYRLDVQTAINKMVEAFGAYISYTIEVTGNEVTARKINISNTSGYELGKRFVYSKDLLNVERTVMMDDVITALYGFGKGEEIGDGYGRRISFKDLDYPDSPVGQMYITDEAARLKYGRNSPTGKKHVFHTVTFDDVEDPEEIYRLTKEKLQTLNEIKINYVADVILLDEQFENVLVGDTVAIIDEDFRGRKLNLKGVIFRIERDLISPMNSKVSLGNYVEDSADSENELRDYIKNFRDKAGVWDRSNSFGPDGSLNASYIKELLDSWNNMLNGAGGYVYAEPGKGIITYDRAIDDNPTSAVQITGGGWRIANSKKPNGDWDWRTLGTGDGIHGNEIIANTITTTQLRSDVGSSLDLTNNSEITGIKQDIENIELTPGPQGEQGKGISSTDVTYQAGSSGTVAPTGTWSSNVPTVSENQYLWTRTIITYTDDEKTTAYSVGKMGAPGPKGDSGADGTDGKGISSTTVTYQASTSGTVTPTGTWQTTVPSVAEDQYLWTRVVINYTSGNPTTSYSIGKMGAQGPEGAKGDKGDKGDRGATGERGPKGDTGTSVSSVTEYYLATNLSNGVTTSTSGWKTTMQTMTATNKYLWNYEVINFSDGESSPTIPVIIGVYGDKGQNGSTGATGRSIVSITEHYLASSLAEGVTRTTSGWETTMQTTTPTNKYLWNYETITWSSGTTTTYTVPIIIGIHGERGPQGEQGPQGTKGDKGATGSQGPQGIQGPKGDNGLPTYTWIAYASSATGTGISLSPTGKDYVGYASGQTSNTPSIATPSLYTWQLVKGATGSQGPQGIQGGVGPKGDPVYTWIKYAETPTSGMTDDPTGMKYIGMAYNKSSPTESTAYSQYQWSLMPQNIEIGGRNLLVRSTITEGSYLTSTGGTTVSATWFYTDYIPVAGYTKLTTSGYTNLGNAPSVVYYDADYAFVKGINNANVSRAKEMTIDPGIAYIRFSGLIADLPTLKIEKGNMTTDWTPAPEDVSREISDTVGTVRDDVMEAVTTGYATITLLNDTITSEATARTELGTTLVEEITSQVQQSADSFDIIFNKLENDQSLDHDEIVLIQSYFRINDNGVVIGKSGSQIEFFAEHNRVGFRENGNDIAYWEGGTMHVDKLIAITTVMVGYHVIEKYDSTVAGNTTVVRMGSN